MTKDEFLAVLRQKLLAACGLLLLFLSVLCTPAMAAPVFTTYDGEWISVPPACECHDMPYSGYSADGPRHNLGYWMHALGFVNPALQYLSGGGFTLTEWAGEFVFGETAYQEATLSESNGVLFYDDKHGPVFTSIAPSGNNGRFHVFKEVISAVLTIIYVSVNDTHWVDDDGQDKFFIMWLATTPPTDDPTCTVNCSPPPTCLVDCTPDIPPCTVNCNPGISVSEPMSFVLFGVALLELARRRRLMERR